MSEKMVSLKRTKADIKKEDRSNTISRDRPAYPWGTTLRFEDAQVDKLGLDEVRVGQDVEINAVGSVISVDKHESADGGEHKTVEIQIERMAFVDPESFDKEFDKDD